MEKRYGGFVWDNEKEAANIAKHGIDFIVATQVFFDPKRKIFTDERHSNEEPRYFCIGMAADKLVTVRFTYREGRVRIIGAGCWRKGRRYYEQK